jgi:FRG domain-containing protein
MTRVPFNDYSELNAYINSLPPAKPGHVRFFRGQYKDFGNMRPTGVRIPLRNERIWRQYCRMLATDMLVQLGLEVEEALSKTEVWAYWYYAIVQHYGPGTHLLDVTHSLDVALWFALHKAITNKRINLRFVYTHPTNPGPTLDRQDDWTEVAPPIVES